MKGLWSVFVIPLVGGALAGAQLGGGKALACICLGDPGWKLSKLEQQPDAPPGEEALWPAQGFLYPNTLNLWQPGSELVLSYGVEAAP